jgi:DNA-binding transcriptional regulator YdaS (Cro superfamily)
MENVFDKFSEVFGSCAALAEVLGIHKMAVYQWRKRGRIPAERCPDIVAASGGRIALHELRPDLYADPSKAA